MSAAGERTPSEAPSDEATRTEEPAAEPGPQAGSLLDAIEAPVLAPARLAPGLRTARLVEVARGEARVLLGGGAELRAQLAPDVDLEIVERALENGDRVLVEIDELGAPEIVGVVATRVPRTLHLEAERVIVDASEELTLRSGKAGLRLREDGDVELVGSRIVTMSRGLFRLVGKMLRLN